MEEKTTTTLTAEYLVKFFVIRRSLLATSISSLKMHLLSIAKYLHVIALTRYTDPLSRFFPGQI